MYRARDTRPHCDKAGGQLSSVTTDTLRLRCPVTPAPGTSELTLTFHWSNSSAGQKLWRLLYFWAYHQSWSLMCIIQLEYKTKYFSFLKSTYLIITLSYRRTDRDCFFLSSDRSLKTRSIWIVDWIGTQSKGTMGNWIIRRKMYVSYSYQVFKM